MATYLKRALSGEFAVLSGPTPPDDRGFRSDRLQILWNDSDDPWTDPGCHLHTDSDEAYIVLKGAMVLEIEDERATVSAGEVCFIPPGVVHAVVEVETPVQALVVRAPASSDKQGLSGSAVAGSSTLRRIMQGEHRGLACADRG